MGNETPDRGSSETPPRSPTLKDIAQICAELNRLGARYVVVGGWAIIQAGYLRATEDIDLLIETTPENEARVIQALSILPDKAASELRPGEVSQYGVVRIGDEVVVDLMKSGCNVTYGDAIKDAITFHIDGVPVPFASPAILWKMKQTGRAKDVPDRLYLEQLLKAQGLAVESGQPDPMGASRAWWERLLSWLKGRP
jgi:hypothetical protein